MKRGSPYAVPRCTNEFKRIRSWGEFTAVREVQKQKLIVEKFVMWCYETHEGQGAGRLPHTIYTRL